MPVRTVILGAAGRDFHDFNVLYRNDPESRVLCFTATQIPGIAGRRYPAALAGPLYPEGIPIVAEDQLELFCRDQNVRRSVFAYSDVTHEHVMHLASRALALGADFVLPGPATTMLKSRLPTIAITAVRTGCGKSAIARWLARHLRQSGQRVAVLRHPMPYGELGLQRVQRFASLADLDAALCTTEEREEYEPHIALGNIVFAGVDYAAILHAAEAEADIVVWDGGNNDFPFVQPDLAIAVADALRPTQLVTHHPGEAVARMADILVINKVDSATTDDIARVTSGLKIINPAAPIVRAASPIRLDDPAAVKGRRVLVIDDGPTITHGGMPYGAGYIAALRAGAASIVDPRESAPAELLQIYAAYPHIGKVLPAVGYSPAQLAALQTTIANSRAEIVVSATPARLDRLLQLDRPMVRALYEFAEAGEPTLQAIVDSFMARIGHRGNA